MNYLCLFYEKTSDYKDIHGFWLDMTETHRAQATWADSSAVRAHFASRQPGASRATRVHAKLQPASWEKL